MSDEQLIERIAVALELGGGTHSVQDVFDEVLAGRAQLWSTDDAVIITEVIDYPRKRVLRFWIAAGELEPVLALSRQIYPWAQQLGCECAQMTGRKGWTKALQSEEWAPTLVLYERAL